MLSRGCNVSWLFIIKSGVTNFHTAHLIFKNSESRLTLRFLSGTMTSTPPTPYTVYILFIISYYKQAEFTDEIYPDNDRLDYGVIITLLIAVQISFASIT